MLKFKRKFRRLKVNNTKDSVWEILAQRRTIARLCALFKANCGERAWKTIRDRLRRLYYLSTADHVWKVRDRKQTTDIGKYSFVNRTIKNWNRLPAEALGTFHCKPKIFRNRVRKAIINGMNRKEEECGENRLKVQWRGARWSVVMWGEVER